MMNKQGRCEKTMETEKGRKGVFKPSERVWFWNETGDGFGAKNAKFAMFCCVILQRSKYLQIYTCKT